jgi:hypothetical protein
MRPQLLQRLPAILSKDTVSHVEVKVVCRSRPHNTIDQPSLLWHINTCLDGIQQFLRRVSRPFLDLILCWLVCNPFKLWLQLPLLLQWQTRYHIVEAIILPSIVCRPQNLADRLNNMFRDFECQVDSIAGNRPVYICYSFQELWQERH